ncbi:MAG: transposase [Candidatus Blackburnbacteria bacterium]|nr:transposase [Candidatus Blackburnbacteria bacterium]
MPGRLTPLITNETYHIFNRGANKQDIFLLQRDYKRFLQTTSYYYIEGPKPKFSKFTHGTLLPIKLSDKKKIVKIFSYCLMPNHFHLLVQQLQDGGISKFVGQLSNSYVKYFNTKHRKIGPLFQGRFKAVRVESEDQFLHVSRYIHLNPIVSHLTKSLGEYPWSSYQDFMIGNSKLCEVSEILSFFSNSSKKYKSFLEDQISYGETLERIKHQLLDMEEF